MASIRQVEQYWDSQPCNIKHSPSVVGSITYFKEVEERKYLVEPHILKFANFPIWKGKRVFEIGCGIGTDAINFVRHGAYYLGVDLSYNSIGIANQRFVMEGYDANCLYWNAEEIMVTKELFDLIYSFGVLHHTPDPRKIIRNIKRMIRPDGQLRIMLYAENSWKNMMVKAGIDHYEAKNGCPIVDTYNEEKVNYLLFPEFQVTNIEQTHIFPYEIEKYKNYEYEIQPYFKAMSAQMFHTLEQNLGQHLLITAKPV